MLKAIALVIADISLCLAQTQYQFVSLTGDNGYRFATATMLNQNGTAIGTIQSDGQAAVFSPQLGTVEPPFAFEINGINAAGDIVGMAFGGSPFVSQPPYDTFFDLSTVFGSIFGSAVAINDHGDIIGYPYFDNGWFPGLNISLLVAINNAGQVLAARLTSTGFESSFLYTPGKGDLALPSPTNTLNNNGDMLFGSSGAQYIQTSSGQIPLPSAYMWTSINDRDEAVGNSVTTSPQGEVTYTPVYYSNSLGLVDLSTRFQNTHAIVQTLAAGINDSGEILVNFMWTALPGEPVPPAAGVGLLVPITGESSIGASDRKREALSRPRTYTANGIRLPTSR